MADDVVLYTFDKARFWKDMNAPGSTLTSRINNEIFSEVNDDWSGRANVENIPNGLRFLTGPDQSTMFGMNVTLDPKGVLRFRGDDIKRVSSKQLRKLGSPWHQGLQQAMFNVMEDYVVVDEEATKKARLSMRASDLRGVTEASKEGPLADLPEGVRSNIASMITGLPAAAGPEKEQMAILKKNVTGKGRRKSKTRASRRTSLGRKTRRR